MTLSDTVWTSATNMSTAIGSFYKSAGGSAWNAECMSDLRSFDIGQEIEFTNITERSVIVGFGDGSSNIGNSQFKLGMRVEQTGGSGTGQMDYIVNGILYSGGATGVSSSDVWKITIESDGYHFKKNGTDFADGTYVPSGNIATVGNAYSEFSSPVEVQDNAGSGPSPSPTGDTLLNPPGVAWI